MNLSSTTVYFILQADSIRGCMIGAMGVPGVIFGVQRVVNLMNWSDAKFGSPMEKAAEERLAKCASWAKICGFFVTAILIGGLVPSTKTIAAMVIAPAIVNSKVVQTDVPELYDMAVTALKQSLSSKSKEEVK